MMKLYSCILLIALLFLGTACTDRPTPALDNSPDTINRDDYQNRLQAMWLGSAIANWTGLVTEGVRTTAPFYTDDDWDTLQQNVSWKEDQQIEFIFQDPWLADDDTDIEYVYLYLMEQQASTLLTAEQISAGWQLHINDYIWVSNNSARGLMRLGARPPVTSMLSVNENALMIDAQLTTEIFGAMAPGMPTQALRLADLPIRTTAAGYSAHAAQFYVVLYSLASQVDSELARSEQVVWLVSEARKYIPDSSKSAAIADFVLADYLANPDKDDWELTRDRVFTRYHLEAEPNGFVYQGWTESSVNFATGLIALLYGEGDFKRTIQIGTLSGWDSDNGTSTMGGLLGLIYGYDDLVAQFPDQQLSDRFQSRRTRDDLPDYLLDDLAAEDTFAMMATRMLPLIHENIVAAGGELAEGDWILPTLTAGSPNENPYQRLFEADNNNAVMAAGGSVTVTVNGIASGAESLVDGVEFDFSGRELAGLPVVYRLDTGAEPVEIVVEYDRPVHLQTIRLVEGSEVGFATVAIELLLNDSWVAASLDNGVSSQPDPTRRYQILDFILTEAVTISSFKIVGQTTAARTQLQLLEVTSLSSP